MKALINPRAASSHKGNYGHALIIAGSRGKMGACVIASHACFRTGVGLLSVNVPADERMILQTSIPEAMVVMREDGTNPNNFSAVGIGSGLGISKASEKLLKQVIDNLHTPLLLDADALNMIASKNALLEKLPKAAILTPHPKEFDRLFGNHQSETARTKKAIKMAVKYNIVIVLKGAKTIITYKEETVVNTSGNAGLAKGGSGDALAGMITAFLAQGYTPFTAAKLGVYLHGLAADIALKKQSMESMLITDVIEYIGEAFKRTMN